MKRIVTKRIIVSAWGLICFLGSAAPCNAIDAFDRHTSYWVKQAARKSKPIHDLSSGEAASLQPLSSRVISPCIVVQTNQGNWAKALIGWGFRKNKDKLVPVLLLERYVTYDRDRRDVAVAHGKNVMLFPGFEFDFDIGQVVPPDMGADVAFNDKRRLVSLKGVKLHGVNGSALPAENPKQYDPNGHVDVRPGDFAGSWKVNADGRWQGVWEISVDDGVVSGRYTSDATKSTFPLKGKITSTQVRHRLRFEVEFAAASQQYDLYLWTSDKSHMAGTTTLINRTFGVFATRLTAKKPDKKIKKPSNKISPESRKPN